MPISGLVRQLDLQFRKAGLQYVWKLYSSISEEHINGLIWTPCFFFLSCWRPLNNGEKHSPLGHNVPVSITRAHQSCLLFPSDERQSRLTRSHIGASCHYRNAHRELSLPIVSCVEPGRNGGSTFIPPKSIHFTLATRGVFSAASLNSNPPTAPFPHQHLYYVSM